MSEQPQPSPSTSPHPEVPESQETLSTPDFKVYKPTNVSSSLPPALPDEYFQPSSSDLKAAQAMLSARTQALVNAPLQLRQARETAEKAKRERWPFTRIRVRFPDRTQLEKVFPSSDKIKSIYAFVRELLQDDVKPIKFILYQSPPKRDFKVSDPKVKMLSLAELQLAPSSILLLRFEDESLNHITVAAPLQAEILAQAVDLPIPPVSGDTKDTAPTQQQTISSGAKTLLSNTEKKIPKWLKLGKK